MDLQIMSGLQTGETPGPVSSLLELRVSEIFGGTSEVQRDIIARTMLGL